MFTRRRVAVFIDGCYYHGCPKHFRWPKTNGEYWHKKIGGNQARETSRQLRSWRNAAGQSADFGRMSRRKSLPTRSNSPSVNRNTLSTDYRMHADGGPAKG